MKCNARLIRSFEFKFEFTIYKYCKKTFNAGTQIKGEGGGLSCRPFLKIQKSALILEKKTLILSMFGLSILSMFVFKMYF